MPLELYKPTKGPELGVMSSGPRIRVTKTGQTVELNIKNVVLEDEGAYQCLAENDAGSDIKTTHFVVDQSK